MDMVLCTMSALRNAFSTMRQKHCCTPPPKLSRAGPPTCDDERKLSMARVRRKATAKTRWNYEIAGIAALGLAVLFGIALILPPEHAGVIGSHTASALRALFGNAAALFPVLIALFGCIIFLEINVPRMIASLGMAALGYFLLFDAALGKHGGFFGSNIWWGVQSLLGVAGARIVLALFMLLLTIWITNVSVKKVIGWCIMQLQRVQIPKMQLALPQASRAKE